MFSVPQSIKCFLHMFSRSAGLWFPLRVCQLFAGQVTHVADWWALTTYLQCSFSDAEKESKLKTKEDDSLSD